MKITPLQQYLILGFLGFAVISFLFYQFGLKPINKEIAALEVERDQRKRDLEEAKKIVLKYVEFKKRADSVQRELEWIQNRIPKTLDKTKMVEVINLLQNRSEIFLTSIQFAPPVASKDASYTEVPVNLRFNSNYKGLSDFLYQVSVSNLFLTAHDLVVTPMTDPAHLNVTLTAQLTLSGIQAKQ